MLAYLLPPSNGYTEFVVDEARRKPKPAQVMEIKRKSSRCVKDYSVEKKRESNKRG